MNLNIHAGGHETHLEMLKIKLWMLIKKINRNPDLSASGKFEAREEARRSMLTDSKKSLKNCY